jgi:hypothetical protein
VNWRRWLRNPGIAEPAHRLATEPLTGFEWFTPDRLVKRTTFSDEPHDDIPPMCIVTERLDEGWRKRFYPET